MILLLFATSYFLFRERILQHFAKFYSPKFTFAHVGRHFMHGAMLCDPCVWAGG